MINKCKHLAYICLNEKSKFSGALITEKDCGECKNGKSA